MSARPHRPWLLWPLVPLMGLGTAAAVYMARHHEVEAYGGAAYQSEVLVGCAEAQGVSCDIVNTSAWSEIFGVPTFAWAVPTYLLVGVLAYFAARGWHRLKPLIAVVGVATTLLSVWLYYVSVYELGYVCLWCMRLYGVNAAILLVGLLGGWTRKDLPTSRELGFAGSVFILLALITVGGQRWFRAKLLDGAPEVAALVADDAPPAEAADDPEGPAPTLAFDVTTEDGKASRITIQPDDAWKGNPKAQVAIVEFADFQCGYCKRTGFELRRVFEAYKDQVVFVYKHFPMDPACNPSVNNPLHRYACHAHAAAVCAQEQGRFWAYHDLLYKNQHQLNDDSLLAYAEAVGLRVPAWEDCMRSGRAQKKVIRAATEGGEIDTHGTPRVWIDGKLFRAGTSAEQLARAVEAALASKGVQAEGTLSAIGSDAGRPGTVPADVAGTQPIPGTSVRIDTFEAALQDGKAVSGKHLVPATRMSWFAAKDACESAGKRMCTEAEWVAACQGATPVDDDGDGELADDMIEGNAYPYGDFHEPGTCWDNRVRPGPTGEPWRPVYTGEMPACVTASGVYDLVGNVEEWVGATPETAVLLGGAFDTADDHARCYRRNDTFGAGYANLRTGFRCCSGTP